MGKFVKILIGIVVVLVVVVVGGIVVAPMIVDKAFVSEQAKSATGRDLTIAGDFDLGLSLSPSIVLSDVSFANASWGSRPQLMTLKRMEAEIEALPLISMNVEVNRFLLEGLDVLIETNAEGQSNLAFDTGAPAAEPAEPAEPGEMMIPVIKDMQVKDVKVTIKDAAAGTEMLASVDVMELKAPDASSPMALKVRGSFNGVPFEADGELGSVNQLTGGDGYPLKVVAKALGAVLGLDGSIKDVAAAEGLNIRVSVKGDSLEGTVDAAKVLAPQLKDQVVPPIGPYDIGATLSGSGEKLGIKDIAVAIGKAEQLLIKADGSIDNAMTQQGLNVGFNVAAKDLSAIVKALALDIPKVWPLDVTGRATSASNQTYAVEDLKILIAGSDIGGNVKAMLGGARPAVEGDFKSTLLDLDKLLAKLDQGKGQKATAKPAAKTKAASDGRVFPADPLPLDAMKAADAAIRFTGEKIVVNAIPIEKVSVDLSLKNGKLDIKPLKATIADGTLETALLLDGSIAKPALDVKVKADQIDYGKLLVAMGMGGYASGKVDMDVDLDATGNSVRELMATLDGHSKIITQKGRLEEKLVKIIMSGFTKLMSSGTTEPHDLNCAVVNFTIKKGMADATGILFDTPDVSVIGLGNIDLRVEKLDMEIDPRNRTAGVTSFIPALTVGGTLASPTALPKGSAVAKGVGKAALGVMTGGLSTLAFAAADAVAPVDKTDYCSLALAGKPLEPNEDKVTQPESKSSTQSTTQPGTTSGTKTESKDAVGDAIGGAINSLFGGTKK